MNSLSVGIIGVGVVGMTLSNACVRQHIKVYGYDTNESVSFEKNEFLHRESSIKDVLIHINTIICICVPTPASIDGHDITAIESVCNVLHELKCEYPVLIISTVCPGTLNHLSFNYPELYLFHCPEFLSNATRNIDMYHSKQVILGVPPKMPCAMTDHAHSFLHQLHPSASIKIVKAIESEIAKLFCNVFYAIKLRTFNGIYSVCHENAQYDVVRQLMIDQGWIYPLHTFAPNIDGTLSVGGHCLPKDCKAAFYWLQKTLAQKENKTDDLYFAMDDLKSMLSNFIL